MNVLARQMTVVCWCSALATSCGGSGDDVASTTPIGKGGAPGAGGSATGAGAIGGAASGASAKGGAGPTGGAAALGGVGGGGAGAGGMSGGGTSGGSGKGGAPTCGGGASGTGGSSGGAGAPAACTPEEKAKAIATMLVQPILPSRFAAGIDLAGNDDWTGITLEQLEDGYQRVGGLGPDGVYPGAFTRLCAAGSGAQGGGAFGPNGEVEVASYVPQDLVNGLILRPGYQGTLIAKSRDGQHTYVISVGKQIAKDGGPFVLNWGGAAPWADELFDALMASYAPAIPPQTCAAGACAVGSFLTASPPTHYLYLSLLGVAFSVNADLDPIVASTPTRIELYKNRVLGFSTAGVLLKLDAEGPVAETTVGASATTCKLSVGMTYGDVLSSCVAVTGSVAWDAAETSKLLARQQRMDETFELTVPGLDLAFVSSGLAPIDVLDMGAAPAAGDVLYAIDLDGVTMGKIANDHSGDDVSSATDAHAAGLVALEYARLVQAELQATRTDVCPDETNCPPGQAPLRTLGDPACLAADVPDDGDPAAIYTQGCTGFEGFITTAPAIAVSPPGEPYLAAIAYGKKATGLANNPSSSIQPSARTALFCAITSAPYPEYCTSAEGGKVGGLFKAAFERVLDVFAKGDPTKLPAEARDPIFYLRRYMRALTKYLLAAGQGQETFDAVHAVAVDPDSEWLALDSSGPGQIVRWRAGYVARELATASGPPTFFALTARGDDDVVERYRFGRHLRRGEAAVHRAMLDHDVAGAVVGGPIGDDVRFSNVFGSRLLHATYGGAPSACATELGAPGCTASPPLTATGALLLDSTGAPILARYAQAIASTGPLVLGKVAVELLGQQAGCSSQGPSPYEALRFPQRQTPLDPAPFSPAPTFDTTARRVDDAPLVVLGAAGSDVTIGKTALDLGGATFDALVRYEVNDGATNFLGVSSASFFGYVFLCRDAATNEWLVARAAETADAATSWIASHPQAAKDCGLSVKLSGGGTVERVASQAASVQLRYVAAQGYVARVSEVAMWNPAAP